MTTAQRIYLDNAATTPMADEVIDAMIPMMREHYGNPSSTHAHGRKVRGIIEEARGSIASLLKCAPGEIFFTSGGTEADNLALRGSVAKLGIKNIISSSIEHHAVLHTVEELHHQQGMGLHFVTLDSKGHVDMDHLAALLQENPNALVSLMHANNEIGTMIDINAVGQMVHNAQGIFHCDTVQTMGHFPFNLGEGHVDFLAGAGHKFNGPKGVGFIYINKKNRIVPEITGGAQEREMRGGTENVIGIVGLSKALEIAYRDIDAKQKHISHLKSSMIDLLKEQIPGVSFNGDPEGRSLYTVLSVSLPPNEMSSMLLFQLDLAGISCSGGSACSSGSTAGSHVINSLSPGTDRSTIRFSFGKHNTLEEIQYTVNQLATWYGNKA
jgi:cysteine desulfurase